MSQLELDDQGIKLQQFLSRLQGEIARRGIVDILRKGINHGPAHVDLFYGTPSPNNPKAIELYTANIFSVTRQVRFSSDHKRLALDMVIFINGLPLITQQSGVQFVVTGLVLLIAASVDAISRKRSTPS